jgi:hypothetical protein
MRIVCLSFRSPLFDSLPSPSICKLVNLSTNIGTLDLTQRLLKENKNRHAVGHWTREDNRNAKELFSQFAHSRNCSAQDPEFWYSVKRSELLRDKVCITTQYVPMIHRVCREPPS